MTQKKKSKLKETGTTVEGQVEASLLPPNIKGTLRVRKEWMPAGVRSVARHVREAEKNRYR